MVVIRFEKLAPKTEDQSPQTRRHRPRIPDVAAFESDIRQVKIGLFSLLFLSSAGIDWYAVSQWGPVAGILPSIVALASLSMLAGVYYDKSAGRQIK